MESPLTPFSGAFDMPAPRGRKFASVVNLCGGFHPRSPSLGNKYESLARGCPTSWLGVIPRIPSSRSRRTAIRNTSWFSRGIKISVRRLWRSILATANACEISRPSLGASFVTRNFPGDVCGDASRVSPVEGIFFALPSYFSSLTFSRRVQSSFPSLRTTL